MKAKLALLLATVMLVACDSGKSEKDIKARDKEIDRMTPNSGSPADNFRGKDGPPSNGGKPTTTSNGGGPGTG